MAIESAKIAVLLASLLAGLTGFIWLRFTLATKQIT
jgi:Na+/H+ antiporter NhaA